MKRFILISALVVAATAAELGLEGLKPSELKEIEKEIAAGNVPPNYVAEKPKRGVAKASDNSFNLLPSSPVKTAYSTLPSVSYSPQTYTQSSASVQTYNPQVANPVASQAYPQTPYRFIYPNQYYPSNQYLTQIQNPYLSSQVASQYAFQPQAPHFVQTPTQLQYVSPPNYSQVPSTQFKALSSKTAAGASAAAAAADAKTATPEQATSQVVLPSNAAAGAHPFHHPQIFMYLVPQQYMAQQPQQYVYPGQQQMLLVSPHSSLLSLLGQQRFASPYTTPAASQLAYLAASQQQGAYQTLQQAPEQYQAQQYQALQQPQQYQTLQQQPQQYQIQETNSIKPINVQETSSSNTYATRTKA